MTDEEILEVIERHAVDPMLLAALELHAIGVTEEDINRIMRENGTRVQLIPNNYTVSVTNYLRDIRRIWAGDYIKKAAHRKIVVDKGSKGDSQRK